MPHQPPLIAHVIHHLVIGGLENGLVNLINNIPHNKYRHAVICIQDYSEFRNRIQRKDVEVYAMHRGNGNDPAMLLKLYRLFRQIKPNIVHSRNISALDSLLPSFLAGVRHRIHGEHGWDVNDLKGKNKKNQWLRRVHRPLIQQYVALSIHTRDYLVERVHVKPKRITQIYNGVDVKRFLPVEKKGPIPTADGSIFSPNKLIIGTVGRLEPVKDQKTLVNAFNILLKKQPDLGNKLQLVLIGGGSKYDEVSNLIHQLGIQDHICMTGPRDNIPELLRNLDIFVLPSLAEGISNTILEAMATQLPVVATDVGGNAELISHKQTGLIVPPNDPDAMADALTQYIEDPLLRETHGLAARQKALDEFSLETMVNRYTQLYDTVLGSV